jgi:hypothetical protein
MKVMLEEISRKKEEAELIRSEEQRRLDEAGQAAQEAARRA